jgi:hypothetical protein
VQLERPDHQGDEPAPDVREERDRHLAETLPHLAADARDEEIGHGITGHGDGEEGHQGPAGGAEGAHGSEYG